MENKLILEKIVNLIELLWNKHKNLIECGLSEETINSHERSRIYELHCNEPWKSMLWCSLSLNNKGSSANAKSWHSKFHDIIKYISPSELKLSFESDEHIFIAMNIIARYFAGGRMLTCSKNKGIAYLKNNESLNKETLKMSVQNSGLFNFESYLKNKSKADITNLFLEWQLLDFNDHRINEYYCNLDLKDLSAKELSCQVGEELGINNKYSRNILMDMRLNKVEYNFAIDSRIDNILDKINFEASSFKAKEKLLQSVLEDSKIKKIVPTYNSRPLYLTEKSITGWELDRILFRFNNELLYL